MQEHELTAWLGPAVNTMTPEQIDRLAAEARTIAERYLDPDEQPEREAALSAAAQHLLGDITPDEAARALIEARLAESRAYAAALQIAVMLVGDNVRQGRRPQKATAARRAGIDRMGLLKALGER
jgi:hypothetical protein